MPPSPIFSRSVKWPRLSACIAFMVSRRSASRAELLLFGRRRSLLIGVTRERVQDALELHAVALLFEQAERPQRPERSGVAQELVNEQLRLRLLELPGFALVFAQQKSLVRGDPQAIAGVGCDRRQPPRYR